jgi:hypothetical protein
LRAKIAFAVAAVITVATTHMAVADPLGPPEVPLVNPLPPYQIMAMVRSVGFEPLGRPVRRGRVYWLRAINRRGQDVGLIVDASSGRILSATAFGAPPPRYGAADYQAPYDPRPPYGRMYEPPPYGSSAPYVYGAPSYGSPAYRYGEPGYGPPSNGPRGSYPAEAEMPPSGPASSPGYQPPNTDRSAIIAPPRTPLPRPRPADDAIASSADITKSTPAPTPQVAPTQAVPAAGSDTAAEKPAAHPPTALPPVAPLD